MDLRSVGELWVLDGKDGTYRIVACGDQFKLDYFPEGKAIHLQEHLGTFESVDLAKAAADSRETS